MIKCTQAWFSGLLTGFMLQLAIGPIFFYILGITLQSGFGNGFLASLGAVLADFTFIFLSIFGVTRFLTEERFKKVFKFLGPLLLLAFGLFFIISALGKPFGTETNLDNNWNGLNSFISTFILTLSSPLSILFWSGIFTTRAMEKNYSPRELLFFGVGAGCATFIFIPSVMLIVSAFRIILPDLLLQWLNAGVGFVLIVYAVVRLFKKKAVISES